MKQRKENNFPKAYYNDRLAKPVLLWVLVQRLYVCLEDGFSIFVTGVPIHELIIYSDKTESEDRVILERLLVFYQMLLHKQLLQHSVIDTWDRPFISLQKI